MLRTPSAVVMTLSILLVGISAHAQNEPIVTSDVLRIRTVSSIDVTQDGQKAVFSVRSIEADAKSSNGNDSGPEKYTYRSRLFSLDLLNLDTQPRQLTFGKRNDSSPVFSPDGKSIAFVRKGEEEDAKSQVWILPLGGGEARQVTSLEGGASNPLWSPDGEKLLVSSSIAMSKLQGDPPWPMERPKRDWSDVTLGDNQHPRPDGSKKEIRAWLARNAEDANPSVINRIAFQGEHDLRGEMSFTHLFLIDADDPKAEPFQITSGFFSHNRPAFMPDGQSIVYVSSRSDRLHPDRVLRSTIWRINTDGTEDHELVNLQGWSLNAPQPHPDGTALAFSGSQLDHPTDRQTQLGIASIDADENELLWLTDEDSYDFSVSSFRWTSDASRLELIFSGPREGGFPLMKTGAGFLEPAVIVEVNDIGLVGVQRFATGGSSIVYSVTSPANPCTLRVIDPRGDRLAFDLNEWVAEKKLSLPSAGKKITRPDGTEVQYWVMEPTNLEAGQKYPVCLEIHGGPSAMWGPGESSMWHEFQLLCSWGYGVVYANPRGSGGYGFEFQKANNRDWGNGPMGDVLAALEKALADHKWADVNRQVVTGGSYAGYLTAYIVGHDHRFQAAVAQRGVYDLQTFFGEGNAWRLDEWEMGGLPWEAGMREIYRSESPFSHVNKIRTPLLIMHSSSDLRTGVSQSEMMYRALKELEKPVEYIRYPGAGHDLSRAGDPTQRMDRLNRIIEFFDRHIDNPRPAPQVSTSSTP